jgi:pantothenate synthetase
LALSSRNSYLSLDQIKQASAIFQGLSSAKHAFLSGETRPSELISMVKNRVDSSGIIIDYCSIVDSETLSSVTCAAPGNRILFAGYIGKTRLIDNIGL